MKCKCMIRIDCFDEFFILLQLTYRLVFYNVDNDPNSFDKMEGKASVLIARPENR